MIYIKEKGFKLEISIKDENGTAVNLSGCTVTYLIDKPEGTLVTKTPTVDNAVSGITSYTTLDESDYNDIPDEYHIQPKVVLSTGSIFYGEIIEIQLQSFLT